MAETEPKTMQDLTSVVRDDCAGPRPWHPGEAAARPADPGAFSAASRKRSMEAVFLEASPAEASGYLSLRAATAPGPENPHVRIHLSLNRTPWMTSWSPPASRPTPLRFPRTTPFGCSLTPRCLQTVRNDQKTQRVLNGSGTQTGSLI